MISMSLFLCLLLIGIISPITSSDVLENTHQHNDKNDTQSLQKLVDGFQLQKVGGITTTSTLDSDSDYIDTFYSFDYTESTDIYFVIGRANPISSSEINEVNYSIVISKSNSRAQVEYMTIECVKYPERSYETKNKYYLYFTEGQAYYFVNFENNNNHSHHLLYCRLTPSKELYETSIKIEISVDTYPYSATSTHSLELHPRKNNHRFAKKIGLSPSVGNGEFMVYVDEIKLLTATEKLYFQMFNTYVIIDNYRFQSQTTNSITTSCYVQHDRGTSYTSLEIFGTLITLRDDRLAVQNPVVSASFDRLITGDRLSVSCSGSLSEKLLLEYNGDYHSSHDGSTYSLLVSTKQPVPNIFTCSNTDCMSTISPKRRYPRNLPTGIIIVIVAAVVVFIAIVIIVICCCRRSSRNKNNKQSIEMQSDQYNPSVDGIVYTQPIHDNHSNGTHTANILPSVESDHKIMLPNSDISP